MATVEAIVKRGIPYCPRCEKPKLRGTRSDCGVLTSGGFWFSYECACSTKKDRVTVKYHTDSDFRLVVGG